MSAPVFTHEPEATLRGSRDYVHSTDLYEEISAAACAASLAFEGPVDFKIKAKIIHRPRYTIWPAGQAAGNAAAACAFASGGASYITLVTSGDEGVTARKLYDEGPAAKASHIKGRKAVLTGETGLRPIEAVTALAVHLHKTALPPPPGQRWMLGQLSIHRALADSDTRALTLEIDKVLGTTMTRTRIDAQDGPLGTMIFILAAG